MMKRKFLAWGLGLAGLSGLLAACGGGGGVSPQSAGLPVAPGPYSSAQYADSRVATYNNVVYSTRPNRGGTQSTSQLNASRESGADTLRLAMDIFVPPNASASNRQPLLVWVHGGGLVTGGKEDGNPEALTYAAAGYVAASINYRLTPENKADTVARENAIRDASEDVMNAVRYLKSQAGTYGIDPDRIVMIGTSGGGTLTLINAVEYDTLEGTVSDYPGFSSKVNASISTGATLVGETLNAAFYLGFDANDTPAQIYHARPLDGETGVYWDDSVVPTQALFQNAGVECETWEQPNLTHTVDLSVGGPYWSRLQPFIFRNLGLNALL